MKLLYTVKDGNGGREFSMKRIAYVICSAIVLIMPQIMLFATKDITGEQWLSFFKVMGSMFIGGYVGGKYVDKKGPS